MSGLCPAPQAKRAASGSRAVEPGTLVDADPRHIESIQQSHERCMALGLKDYGHVDFDPVGRSDLSLIRDRNERLYLRAAPVMEMLFEQIVNTHSMVVLTDAQGTILHSIGDNDFLEKAEKVALAPGVAWSEPSKGTNAIGTALITETPTLVHAHEHFIRANHFLTCSAAPILDPRGNILGVLDVTGDHRSYHRHTMGLVKMSARMIENHLFSDNFRDGLRVHFHARPEFIGTLMEGIVAVGRDGRLMGANRSALDQLGMSAAALRMQTLTTLFGTTVPAVMDHFRSPLAVPMMLSLPNGLPLFARAQFNWPAMAFLNPRPEHDEVADTAEAVLAAAVKTATTTAKPSANADANKPSGLKYLQTGDPQMEAVIEKIRRVLNRDIPIMILGETGVGKELLARAVHQDSARARQPFVAVNCASIPETLIEAELFGYEEGAFTGARRKGAPGKILQANGGTLFLDEIGDMPLALQARLLRVLQERQVTPLGSHKSIAVDVAIISATHRPLRDMIARREFREDLYYRLNGLVVRLPSLRERTDLTPIVRKIIRAESPQRPLEVSSDVMAMFQRYHWPGNVRQLANVLRTAVVMAGPDSQIVRQHLSDDFLDDVERAGREAAGASMSPDGPAAAPSQQVRSLVSQSPQSTPPSSPTARGSEPTASTSGSEAPTSTSGGEATASTLEELEVAMIRRAVEAAGGNISVASKRLGISRNTIYRKLRWNAASDRH